MKDYYKILGIQKSASEEEIKKAYRKLAHEYHPDKTHGNEQKFKEINEAYQILSNREKRSQYDRFGQVFEGGASGAPPGWENFGFGGDGFKWSADWRSNLGEDLGDFGEIFESFFEQFGGAPRRQTYTRGSDIEIIQEIILEEAFSGLKKRLFFETNISCDKCNGLGYDKSKGLNNCTTCQGRGEIKEQRKTFFGNFAQVRACPACHGRGQIPKSSCAVCGGKGRKLGEKKVEAQIAPGVENGQVIKIAGMGEAGESGSGPGDLYVVVKVKPHPIFERKGNDLYAVREITVTQAVLGKKIEFKDISGEVFSVVVPPGFSLKDNLRVGGRGMPRFGSFSGYLGRGDLFISFNLKLPKHLSAKAKKLLEELDEEI